MARRELPPYHVARPALAEPLARAHVGLIEAGGGYGKSVLSAEVRGALALATAEAELDRPGADADLVAAALRRAYERAGLSDVAAALEDAPPAQLPAALAAALERAPAPTLLIVDEVHLTGPAGAELLADLAAQFPAGHHLLLTGRRLPGSLARLRDDPSAALVDAAALAFGEDEVRELLAATLGREPDDDDVAAVAGAAGGWPAAAVVAAARLARGARPGRGDLTELLAGLLGPAAEPAALLAHLPLLSSAAADAAAGEGAWEAVIEAGLPLAARADGWFDLPGPVREALAPLRPLPARAAARVAHVYAAGGELAAGLALLASLGAGQEAVELLARSRWQDLAALGMPDVRAALALAGAPVRARCPRALIAAARAAEGGALGDRARLLAETDAALAHAPTAVRLDVDAERACDLARDGEDDAAEALALRVLETCSPRDGSARARALMALGRVGAWRADPASLAAAEEHLAEAAAVCAAIGETEWRADALLALGYRICFARGDLEAATQHTAGALALLPAARRRRAFAASFYADVLAYEGMLDEAEAAQRETAEIGRALGDQRLRGYAAWVGARIASMRGDTAACAARLTEAERYPGDWFEHPTGIEFLAEGAEMLARCGDEPGARALLERAEVRADAFGHPEIAWYARGAVEARYGDAGRAEEALVAYDASPQQPQRDAWRTLLVRAHAAARRGDSEAARRLAGQAFEGAAQLGRADLPSLHEPDLAPALAVIAARGSRAAADAAERPPVLRVSVLGGFAVTADGRPIDPPPGHGSTLVKLVALTRGGLHAEEAIEALWPDTDVSLGRSRLRNLLNRVRERCGELVLRDGEALSLAAGVEVDAAAFEAAVTEALAARDGRGPGLARSALARYRGELLPADRYAPWAAAPRERLARRHRDALDMLASDARERGDLDEAIRLLDAAIAEEPLDERRYAECAELLLAQGRRGTARTLLERAAAQRAELALPASPRLARLLAATGAAGEVAV